MVTCNWYLVLSATCSLVSCNFKVSLANLFLIAVQDLICNSQFLQKILGTRCFSTTPNLRWVALLFNSYLYIIFFRNLQKQPPRGVLKKRYSENIQQVYRRTPMPKENTHAISIKLFYNFIEIALRHGCSPVNLLHIFRTPFSRNNCGWLLPYLACQLFSRYRKTRKASITWKTKKALYLIWQEAFLWCVLLLD